jgi:menaquinone-dependent protoporphyrinogen oxidase
VRDERRYEMRVLVAAASRYGGTAGIAEAIARRLEDEHLDVDVVPVEDVEDVAGYDAVVLGSAVYAGRWMKSARHFVDENAAGIVSKQTWLFSSGPVGNPPKPDDEGAVKLGDLLTKTGAHEHRVFAGKLDKSRMTFGDRAVVTAFRSPEGDFRDWEEIAEWAEDIAEALR